MKVSETQAAEQTCHCCTFDYLVPEQVKLQVKLGLSMHLICNRVDLILSCVVRIDYTVTKGEKVHEPYCCGTAAEKFSNNRRDISQVSNLFVFFQELSPVSISSHTCPPSLPPSLSLQRLPQCPQWEQLKLSGATSQWHFNDSTTAPHTERRERYEHLLKIGPSDTHTHTHTRTHTLAHTHTSTHMSKWVNLPLSLQQRGLWGTAGV